MAVPTINPLIRPEIRAARRKLLLQDTIALLTLALIVAVLSVLTYFLHRSFEDHRRELGQRWYERGEIALHDKKPQAAVYALRSALAYAPNRTTEIELARALAEAGRTQEAIAYFKTLRDQQPGNGIVNLQLARLAAEQHQTTTAIDYYQAALDGTWDGDGYARRRTVRLELAEYLIAEHLDGRARTELLIAEGNAPDQPDWKLRIAGLLEQCHAPADAFNIYRDLADAPNAPWAALAGAGRTAYNVGMMMVAHDYLDRAQHARNFAAQSKADQQAVLRMNTTSQQLLALYPGTDLSIYERAARVREDVKIARALFESCQAPVAAAPPTQPMTLNTPKVSTGSLPLNPLAKVAAKAKSLLLAPIPTLSVATDGNAQQASAALLAARWAKVPQPLKLFTLEQNPQLEQTLMQLVYDTEKDAATRCGQPQGNNALLYQIAQGPYLVEQR